MTATCTLCGQVITAEPDTILDSQRDDRTLGRLGGLFRSHMGKHHANEPQAALDPAIMHGNISQLIGVMGVTAQGAVLYSYLQSSDPIFLLKVGQMKEIVTKAMAQKALKPAITLVR